MDDFEFSNIMKNKYIKSATNKLYFYNKDLNIDESLSLYYGTTLRNNINTILHEFVLLEDLNLFLRY